MAPLLALLVSISGYFIVKRRKTRREEAGNMPRPALTGGYSVSTAFGVKPNERFLTDGADTPDEYDDLISRLNYLLETEKIFQDPDVRISDVADRLSTTKNRLSKAISIKTGKNFCQLIHSYRVREAMRLYTANQKLSIGQLCKMVGFNSMTTFNTVFGRNTGYTTAEWCKNYRKNLTMDRNYGVKKNT